MTRASDGQAIQTLEDLTTGCSGGTGPDDDDDGDTLDLGMKLTFNSDQQTLTVDNDDDVEQPFTATACVLGEASGAEDCTFADTTILPFAAGVGDPVAPELASRFTASGTLTLENQGSSNASVILNVPETAGAFTVTNASALQNITLAPAQSTTLDIEFSPIESGSGCGPNEDTGMIDCTATLSLASSHQIEVTLEGQAKVPTAEPKLDEVAPQDSTQVLAALLPDIISLDFGQALVGIQTKSRLLQLSNTGVRDLVINSLAAQDAQQNFRLGSIYQGTDFETRVWKVGQQPWTVPPTGDSNLYFFLNYGPFGSVAGGDDDSTRNDQASLLVASAEGSDTLFLVGTAKEDRRATLAVYIRDETRFTVTGAFDVEGPDGEHLYRATSQFFSFRQDSTPDRAVYVRNDGVSAGVDDLVVNCLEITTATPEKFTITWDEGVPEGLRTCSEEPAPADDDDDDAAPADDDDDDDDDAAPADDDDDDAAPEETTLTLAPQDFLKIGTMTYAASGSGSHTIHSASLTIDALSQQGAVTIPPIIGGNPTTDNNNQVVAFDLKGASGAPTGTFDLKVHRLIAGFERKINAGLQPTLNVSSATRGIIDRFNNPSFPSGTYKDVFTMQDGIVLNPVDGTATLKSIVTPVDPNPNEPILPSALDGLRLFNAPGSIPSQQEYFVQCAALNGSCGFFYLYIGDWTDSTTPMECNGDPDRLPISTGYSGSVAEREAVFNKVLKPEISTEFNCMNSASGIGDSTGGVFDPVTGELRFEDLAVRLYAPDVPGLGGADVDTTMRLSLTSGCVSEDMVPDSAARPTYTVPQNTLDDTSFNQTLMPTNPLLAYVDEAGTTCSQREIFGRPMFQTPTADQAATLDNGSDSDTLNFKGFDLAGVGRDVASDTSVAESNLYIIIRAEIGNF